MLDLLRVEYAFDVLELFVVDCECLHRRIHKSLSIDKLWVSIHKMLVRPKWRIHVRKPVLSAFFPEYLAGVV